MKINFLGDSITAGAAATTVENKYVSLVGKILGCETFNFGVSGTRIAKQTTPSECERYDEDFLERAKKMGDADMVFVFGGTNDYGHGDAQIGNIDDETSYTFFGALNNLIKYLSEKYGKEKLRFILPIPRYNQASVYGEGRKTTALYPLSDYINAEKKVLEI
jgi:lysophospholipase L1-like esterase